MFAAAEANAAASTVNTVRCSCSTVKLRRHEPARCLRLQPTVMLQSKGEHIRACLLASGLLLQTLPPQQFQVHVD